MTNKNNNIYLIMHGYYSDWAIDGYFKNPEDAYNYCELFNSNKKKYDDDRYVVEVEEKDLIYDRSKFEDYYHKFSVRIFCTNGTYDFIIEHDGYSTLYYSNEIREIETPTCNLYIITIYLKKYDKEKAKKIAQDMLSEYLYKKMESDTDGDNN